MLRRRSRKRALRTAAGITAVLAAAAGLVFAAVRGGSGGVAFAGDLRTGGTLQSLRLPALKGGGTVSYDQFRSEPLVLNFFASWCPYCIAEMPSFQQVHEQFGSKVAFLGVSQSDSKSASISLAGETGVRYRLAIDANGDFFRATGSTGMPTTLFIAPGGRIAFVQVGPLDAGSLSQAIQQYLGVSA
ncbi:MAG TPA: TlpA disulfide reductase family protein [Actinomycetota bacterium]|jgi:peroxiredoxin